MRLKNYLLIVKLFLENSGAFSTPIFALLPRFIGENCDVKQDGTLKVLKKTVLSKVAFAISMLFLITFSYGQNFKPFSPRFDSDVKGSMVMIGNNILGKDNNPYNINSGALSFNENIDMKYIDIDGDPATFSSSSADLIMPNPQCFKIVYAGLYWGALLQTGSRSDINKIKLKIPGGSYQDVTGAIIYDANVAPVGTNADKPYACYADITALVQGATNPIGTYTVANITSSLGFNGTTGLAAGWNLIVIYEDPTKSAQSITTFDGFSAVSDGETLVFEVSGFRSRPAGAVNVAFGIAGLEGDKDEVGSKLEINGKAVTTAERPSNHFFNSTINNLAGNFTARNPNGSNTLGFDSGIISVPNPQQTVVDNNATKAKISLQMAGKKGTYYSYFNVFAIDIIAPEIVLTKQVQDAQGNDASTANVVLGQNLFYVIGFQNIGNDPATQFTIRDVLPNNIIFNYPADITYLPPGVTATYDAATRSITFSIDKTLVEIGDPRYEIRFKVQVVPTCNQLSSACSNEIKNQAFATYRGVENTLLVTDDPSLPSYTTCNITTAPSATNFLVGVSGCSYGDSQVLCGNNVLLTASNGYASYSWSRDPSGVPVIGTGQTYLATQLGKYYVHNTAAPPCFLNIVEEINVVPFGNTVTNPVIPFADNVVTCSNDGKSLPLIYLCGANATRAIQTNVSDGSTIVWEKLNEASCAAVSNSNCANENSACTWTQVGTGPDYTATAAGQYRMTLNYSGGCFNRFYFNVYQNLLSPTVTKKDIVCNTPGRITVGGVPSDYEYSLSPTGPFQSSNVFDIPTQNLYTVYIRQVGVTSNPCLFTVPDVFIRERNFTVSTVATAPLCNGGKGSLKLAANDVEPQYFYKISQGGVLINSVGPILASDYTFANLNSGVYDVEVSTEDGCIQAFQATVPDTPPLTATVTLTKPLTCTDGEITVYPVGGTAPYTYFVNNSTNYETSPVIAVPTAGVYTIDVFDANSCTTRVSISVAGISPPTFDVVKTDLSCSYVVGDGTISLTNILPNGNALRYSIDNGVTFLNSPIFTDLTAGNYNVVVEYSVTYATGTSVCTTPPQSITIAVPVAITGSATLTAPYTCLQTATIEAQSVSGGTGVYQYSINGTAFQASNVFTGLTDGTYTITIKDANNCTFVTNAVTVAPLTPPTNLDFSATDLTCPSNTSNVTLSATGGFGVKTYQITAPAGSATPYQASNVFSGLAPGTYTFQVKDEKDCTYQESYSIAPLATVVVVGQVVSNVQCFGTNTGSVRFTVSGSTGFTYTINGTPQGVGASPIDLINLTAGTYTIVITNTATNCTATTSVTIAQPAEALSVTTTVTPIKCNANGSIVVNATGGWGGNSYTLTQPDATVAGPQPGNTFTNLTQPGTYTVSVTDSNNCTVTDTFTLSTPTPPTASIAGSDLCYDTTDQATLIVTATSGQSPYQYSIDNGVSYQLSNTFANVTPGNYTIIVKDAYGCKSVGLAQTIAAQLTVTTVLTKDLDCNTPPDATITGTISGGYTGFTYAVSVDSGTFTSLGAVTGSTFTYNTATPGTYRFQVKDANNCPAQSGVITINPLLPVTVTPATINPTCNGGTNGSVTLTAGGGVGPYTYNFNNLGFSNTTLYTGLIAGTAYPYQVMDSKGCVSVAATVTLTQPLAIIGTAVIIAPYTCLQTATIEAQSVAGGTAGYTYSINGVTFQAGNVFTGLTNGTYSITIKDANNCTGVTLPVTIAPLTPPTDLSFTNTALSCPANTSDVTLTATGGSGVKTYTIIAPAAATANVTGATDGVFTGLAPGTYTFQVKDDKDCTYQESYTIVSLPALTVVGQVVSNVQCFGSPTGSVRFTVSGATNFTYTINTVAQGVGISPINLAALPAGSYTIVVTNTDTNCTATTSVTIAAPTAALAVTTTVTPIKCNADGSVVVNAIGGWGGNTYTLTPQSGPPIGPQASNTFTNLTQVGLYTASVTDANNCIVTATFTLSTPTPPTAGIAGSDLCYDTTNQATLTVTAGSGQSPYQYSIDNGVSYQLSNTFANVTPGNYTIIVKDAYGCKSVGLAQTIAAQLTVTTVLTKDLDCNTPPDATITGTISGGYTGFTYAVSVDSGTFTSLGAVTGSTFTYNTATPGTYRFQVKDANNCPAQSGVITIKPIVYPVISSLAQVQQIYCYGDSTGAIKVNIDNTKGVGPFTINVVNTTTSTPYGSQTSGLPAGDYEVTITDAKGCTTIVPSTINIPQPADISVDFDVFPIECDPLGGVSKGRIVINSVSGGNPNFTYIVTGTNGYNQTEGNTGGNASVTFDIVDFGLYQITVVDQNGCSKVIKDQLVASPPNLLNITVTSPPANCTTGGSATVAVGSAFSGSGPFYFSIYTGTILPYPGGTWLAEDAVGSKKATFLNLIPGVTYTFIVYDSFSKCYHFETGSAPIPTNSTLIVDNVVPKNVTCKGNANGSVTFTVNSSYPINTPFDYEIFDSLTLVSTGVTGSGIIVAPTPNELTLTTSSTLSPGNYFVLIKEILSATNNGCSVASSKFTISESGIALTVSATILENENCNKLGQVSVIAQGGTAGYTYQVLPSLSPKPVATDSGWVNTNTFSLAANSYIAYAKDANGCIQETVPFTLSKDPTPVVAAVVANQCTATEGNFAIDVTVPTAGIAPYSFAIDGGAFQTQTAPFTLSNLSSGPHSVEIKDVNGCGNKVNVTILAPLGVTPTVTALPSCANNDGVITVNATGGSAAVNYTYTLLDGASVVLVPAQPSKVFSGLAAGSYQVQVTDGVTTCSQKVPVVLSVPTPVTFSTTKTDVSCNGGNNGTITVVLPASNDNPVYTYEITAGPTLVPPQTSNIFTGLAVGTYTIKVNSGRGCSFSKTETVGGPSALIVDASSFATSFGCAPNNSVNTATVTINETAGTGTAPYMYSINGINYFPTNTFNIIDNGTSYSLSVYIKDANGCVATGSVAVTTLPKITAATVGITAAIDCNNTGSVAIMVTGGSGTFTYQMLPSLATQPANTFGITTPGDYYFRVNDVTTGCYFDTAVFTVVPFNTIDVVATPTTAVTCFGDTDGAIAINVTGYLGAYSYEVFDSLGASVGGIFAANTSTNPQPITGLLAGNYTVVVTETASPFCVKTSNVVTVGSPNAAVSLSVTTVNDNCKVNAGQIVADAQGGTSPYKYQILPVGSAVPAVTDPGWVASNILNAESGNYVVYVKDANNCPQSRPAAIGLDPTPVVSAVLNNQCAGTEGNFAIDVTVPTVGMVPYSFAIDGGAFQTQTAPFTISNLSSGTHTVQMKDFNGCGNLVSVTILAPLGLTPTITALPTCANNDGTITVNATGGSVPANYTYTLLDGASTIITGPQPSKVFSGLAAGSYQVQVTDGVTTCSQKVPVVLSAPTPVTFSTTKTDVSCNGGNNGTITVVLPASNDNPVYTYEITAGPTLVSPQTTSIFTGLTAGTYTVRVNSGRGCFFTDNVVVNEPLLALSVSGTATPFACAPDNTKTVSTVTVTELAGSGTTPYLYSIDGINYTPTNTFSVIDNGLNYTLDVFVKDANGCIANGQVPITTLIPLTGTVNPNTPIDCNGTGSIAVLASGGSGDYSYQLLPGGVAQPSNIFNITTPGTYYFQVNDVITGCYFDTAAYTVLPFNTIDVVATATTPVTCFGDANGAISINVTGYTGAFDYEVFDNLGSSVVTGSGIAPTTQLIPGLSAGNFTVNVTEIMSPFCAKTSNAVTVASPALPLAVVANETASVTCANNQGTITAVGTGGWGSLQYELVGPINVAYSTSSTFNNLVAGNYTVNVKDAKGCIRSSNLVQLSVPTPITVTASPNVAAVSCNEDTSAVITVNTITGGSGNYLYTLVRTAPDGTVTKNGPQMSDVFNNLGAGTYQVLVSDDWSCSGFSNTIVIAQPTGVTTNLVVAATQTCLTQTRLTLSANGGTPPYTYSADGISYGATTFNPSVTFPVGVGTYHYYVKDSNNCVGYLSNDITIDPLPPLVINLDKTNAVINCAGDNTGVIVATAQGGLGNYSYTLLNGSGAIVQGPAASGNFTGLFAGNYQVKVDSGDCTTLSSVISITQPAAPLAATYVTQEVTCNGANNGMLTVNAFGGTGIIKYAISPNLNQFFDTNIFDKLAPGNYDVIVQDVLGCYVKINFDITEPAPIVASTIPGTILPEICFGDKDGAFMIDVAGGVLPYGVSLDNPNGTYTTGTATQTQFDFTGLTGGTHTVYIRDANGCGVEWVVVLPESVKINPITAVDYSCVNNAANNTVTVTVDASITNPADLDYSLDGAPYQMSNIFTNVVPGTNHYIDVRHTNGCIQRTANFEILQIDPLALMLADGGLNEIVATATGGGGGYRYTFNGESNGTKNTLIIYKSGNYTVEVTDANGCVVSATRYFDYIDVCIPNYFTPNGDGISDGWAPGCTVNYKDLTFDIFDRYGRKIATYRLGEYWDGKYNGQELPSGDYWYVLRLNDSKDNREFVGHFTLYR